MGQPSGGFGPIVIACAEADATSMDYVAHDLELDAHAVEIVRGVAASPSRLEDAVDRHGGQGLYVVCLSASLRQSHADELAEVLRAKRIPLGRTLTVASTKPKHVKDSISAALRHLEPEATTVDGPPASPPVTRFDDLTTNAVKGGPLDAFMTVEEPSDLNAIVLDRASIATGQAPDGSALISRQLQADLDPPTRPVAPTTPPSPAPTAAVAQPRMAPIPTWQYFGVAIGAIGLVIVFYVFVRSPGPEPDEIADATPSKTPSAIVEPREGPGEPNDDPDSQTPLSGPATDREEDEPSEDPESPIAPAPAGEQPGQVHSRVLAGIRARELRALDVLVATADEHGPLEYGEAASHCDDLELAELEDWRLPDIGELGSLAEANMIGRANYWSRTAADTFGDQRWAYSGRRRRPITRDNAAMVVCVRGRIR